MQTRFSLAIAMLALANSGAFASELIEVRLGYSQVIGPVAGMATVIVGDDGVADATLGGGGTIILTGRTLGATNLIVLDQQGQELLASPLQVVPLDRRPTQDVRVVRGALGKVASNAEYVCGPDAGCAAVESQVSPSVTYSPNGNGGGTTTSETSESPETPATPETIEPPESEPSVVQEQVSLNP